MTRTRLDPTGRARTRPDPSGSGRSGVELSNQTFLHLYLIARTCETPPLVENAAASNNERVFGNVITFQCKQSYKIAPGEKSTKEIRCEIENITGNIFWKGKENLIKCIPLFCGTLKIFYSNLDLSKLENEIFSIGDKKDLICDQGYYIPNLNLLKSVLECKVYSDNLNAEWEPQNIKCEGT